MGSVFEWEAPPPRTRTRTVASKNAVKLANNRGQWAKVYVYDTYKVAHNKATKIRSGKIKGYQVVGSFQAEVRRTAEGYCVYAKCTSYSKAFRDDELEVEGGSSDS